MANSTPPRGFGVTAWNKILLDYNSPSASCKLRAIRAMNNPANAQYYSRFDVENDENSTNDIEPPIEMPRTIKEVMQNVRVYVEVRSGTENRTEGIKGAIANLGAQVNDRLLRNTTHVVFKDGLQSTYNKAKSWSIPIVSILWIEACKKHLILMEPRDYPISNIDKYENPDPFEKTKRQKVIQPDTLMKKLHRPIPKSKLMEELKKQNETNSSLSNSNGINKTAVTFSPNVTSLTKKIPTAVTSKSIAPRKSMGRKLDSKPPTKPQNTIRSCFEKQLEKSRILSSQTTVDSLSDDENTIKTNDQTKIVERSPDEKSKVDEQTNGTCLVTGTLHKRLTRRNSMTMQTPTKNSEEEAAPPRPSVASSVKKRRCTMFTPSKPSIDEEDDDVDDKVDADSNVVKSTPKTLVNGNHTINKTIAMEVCNETKGHAATKCNSMVRQLLNTELMKTPRDNGVKATANNFVLPKSNLRRRTTYTPQPMEETKVQAQTVTPISSTQRRQTMNVNDMATPLSRFTHLQDELIESKSCDAILTPTNHKSTATTTFSTTPLIRSLSKTHIDHIRSSTSKTLLDEYNNTFSSKKTPVNDKRRTIANITMDIINQRIENINRNASFNRSTTDLLDDSLRTDLKTPTHAQENVERTAVGAAASTTTTPAIPATEINGMAGQLKPLKRKLFTPAIFPENSQILTVTPQKTDKKTATQKRKRNDLAASEKSTKTEEKKSPVDKTTAETKKVNSRRSTLFHFQDNTAILSKAKLNATVAKAHSVPSASPGLVFTSMHKPQIDFITEAVKKLGKFIIQDKVSVNTTHLVALDNRRTINILRGLIRGVWIVTYDWVLKSVEANQWQSEVDYEMRSFSKAVEINRIEHSAFGRHYRMDIFRNYDGFYLTPNLSCKYLRELITLCYGKVTQYHSQSRYFITEHFRSDIDSTKFKQIHPGWILDSITQGQVQQLGKYLVNEKSQSQSNSCK